MSDRTRNLQTTPQEANDLSNLRTVAPDKEPPHSNTDLSTASIQSIPVARLSRRSETRSLSSLIPSPTISTLRDQIGKDSPGRRAVSSKPNGILTNPYYKYEGGPLGRLIAFLANILKAIETTLLGRRKPAPARPPKVTAPPQPATQSKQSSKKVIKPSEAHKPVRDNR